MKKIIVIILTISVILNFYLCYLVFQKNNVIKFDSNLALMYSFVRNGCQDQDKMLKGMEMVKGATGVAIREGSEGKYVTATLNGPFSSPYVFKESLKKYSCQSK